MASASLVDPAEIRWTTSILPAGPSKQSRYIAMGVDHSTRATALSLSPRHRF